LILVVIGFTINNRKNQYSVCVIKSAQGWGYDILHGGKIIIHQPYMPGISGHVAFKNKSSARKTGQLVVKKFREKRSPAINIGELNSIIKDTN
jgi:hypothetical protein